VASSSGSILLAHADPAAWAAVRGKRGPPTKTITERASWLYAPGYMPNGIGSRGLHSRRAWQEAARLEEEKMQHRSSGLMEDRRLKLIEEASRRAAEAMHHSACK